MRQHTAPEQVAVHYADGITRVWETWEPSLRSCERLLSGKSWRSSIEPDDLANELRRAQYRAHTASEFANGLAPPPSATEPHVYLIVTLGACRDALGVLAVRAELDELDDDSAHIGLQAIDATRDAFVTARSTTALVHAWVDDDHVDPEWMHPHAPPPPRTGAWSYALWMVLGTCLVLLGTLIAQVLANTGHT